MGFVLSETAITNFSMPPQSFNDMKDMFHLRTHTALPLIPLALPLAQRSVSMTSQLYPPVDAGRFILLPPVTASISTIAVNSCFVTMKQITHHVRVMDAGSGDRRAVGQAAGTVRAHVQLHPKVPFLALSHAAHLRVARATGVLGRRWCRHDRRVYNGSLAHQQTALLQMLVDFLKQFLGQSMPLEQMPKIQNRCFIRHLVLAQLDASKPSQRLNVIKGIFHRWIGEVEPLLQKVNPQHLLQCHRRSPVSRSRIVSLDHSQQLRPRYDLFHFFEKLFATSFLFLVRKCQSSKGRLAHSVLPSIRFRHITCLMFV